MRKGQGKKEGAEGRKEDGRERAERKGQVEKKGAIEEERDQG